MEQLTRMQTNLALLRKHQADNRGRGRSRRSTSRWSGLRVGDFVLVTFPGELTVQIGLNIKKASPHELPSSPATPTATSTTRRPPSSSRTSGGAQEDSDCMLAPEWQAIFECEPWRSSGGYDRGIARRLPGEATNARAKTVTVLRTVIAKMSL